MSTAIKQPYSKVYPIARKVADGLSVACTRIELAGSLRRQKDIIGDIEIVAIPDGDSLYDLLDKKLSDGVIAHLPKKRWGLKLRSFLFAGFQFDVFIQPDPATFGVNMMIRTGSSEFSHKMVTRRDMGGWMPDHYQVEDARVWRNDKALETPEETDVFALWRMDYVEPERRTPAYIPVLREVSLDFTIDELPEMAHAPRFTFADAERLTAESATWPLPTFEGGPGAAAQRAIEVSEAERVRGKG